jgi:hypothetical protein
VRGDRWFVGWLLSLFSWLLDPPKISSPPDISCWLPLKITATDGILPPHCCSMEAVAFGGNTCYPARRIRQMSPRRARPILSKKHINSPSFLDSSAPWVNWNVAQWERTAWAESEKVFRCSWAIGVLSCQEVNRQSHRNQNSRFRLVLLILLFDKRLFLFLAAVILFQCTSAAFLCSSIWLGQSVSFSLYEVSSTTSCTSSSGPFLSGPFWIPQPHYY